MQRLYWDQRNEAAIRFMRWLKRRPTTKNLADAAILCKEKNKNPENPCIFKGFRDSKAYLTYSHSPS